MPYGDYGLLSVSEWCHFLDGLVKPGGVPSDTQHQDILDKRDELMEKEFSRWAAAIHVL